MTSRPDTRPLMRDCLHALAEHILRMPASTARGKWLKEHVAQDIASQAWVECLDRQYRSEYPYADAPTEYIAKTLQAFDQEAC